MSINCFRAFWEPSITQLYSVLYFSWVVKSNQIFGVMGIDIMMLSATAPEFLMLLYIFHDSFCVVVCETPDLYAAVTGVHVL